MLKKVTCLEDERILYEYFNKISPEIPYYYPVSFDTWRESMFDEIEGMEFYNSELETYLLYEEGILKGFIQYGTPVVYEGNNDYVVIKNMHYARDSKNPESLMDLAMDYFKTKNVPHKVAFFIWYGMECYATHGKLHESQFHIEDLLSKYSFVNNETNVYFVKDLNGIRVENDAEIVCEIYNESEVVRNFCRDESMRIEFFFNGEQIGVCDLRFMHSDISFLVYLEIFEKYRRQNLGTRCMNNIFYILKKRAIQRIDLDTHKTNIAAQALYTKTGFVDTGLTKSYIKEPNPRN